MLLSTSYRLFVLVTIVAAEELCTRGILSEFAHDGALLCCESSCGSCNDNGHSCHDSTGADNHCCSRNLNNQRVCMNGEDTGCLIRHHARSLDQSDWSNLVSDEDWPGLLAVGTSSSPDDLEAESSGNTAYCVLGQRRGFVCDQVQQSIRNNVVKESGGGDVFVVLKEELGDEQYRNDSMADDAKAKFTDEALKYANNLDARVVIIQDGRVSDDEAYNQPTNPSCPELELSRPKEGESIQFGEKDYFRSRYTMVSLDQARCFDLVKKAEERRGKKYSAIVKLRSDQLFCEPIGPKYIEMGQTEIVTNHNDHAAFVPRDMADVFFSAADEVLNDCVPRVHYDDFCHKKTSVLPLDVPNECLLANYLRKHNMTLHVSFEQLMDTCLWHNPTGSCNPFASTCANTEPCKVV